MKIVKSLCWYYLNMCFLNFCYCSNIYFPTINHYLNNVKIAFKKFTSYIRAAYLFD